ADRGDPGRMSRRGALPHAALAGPGNTRCQKAATVPQRPQAAVSRAAPMRPCPGETLACRPDPCFFWTKILAGGAGVANPRRRGAKHPAQPCLNAHRAPEPCDEKPPLPLTPDGCATV